MLLLAKKKKGKQINDSHCEKNEKSFDWLDWSRKTTTTERGA